MLRFLFDHPEFCIAFVLVLFAVGKATKASVSSISYATITWAIAIVAATGFPFWSPGETLTYEQLGIGSVASFAVISALSLLFDRSFIGKSLEERRKNWG